VDGKTLRILKDFLKENIKKFHFFLGHQRGHHAELRRVCRGLKVICKAGASRDLSQNIVLRQLYIFKENIANAMDLQGIMFSEK